MCLFLSLSLRCQNPPNFLRASALSEHISPVVVIPAESSSPETEHMVDLVTEDLVDTDIPVQPVAHLNMSHYCFLIGRRL